MRRLFFALWPPASVRSELASIAATIACGSARRVPDANLHVTLLFLGNVEQSAIVRLCAAAAAVSGDRFALRIDNCGWWRRSGIGWLAPSAESPALSDLVEELRRRVAWLGVAVETRPYRPHVTICRRLSRPPQAPRGDFGIRWPVAEFSLMESTQGPNGVYYERLHSWPLGAVSGP